MTEKKRSNARKVFDKVTDWVFYVVFVCAMIGGMGAFVIGVRLKLDLNKKEAQEQQLNEMIHDDRLRHIRKNKIIA